MSKEKRTAYVSAMGEQDVILSTHPNYWSSLDRIDWEKVRSHHDVYRVTVEAIEPEPAAEAVAAGWWCKWQREGDHYGVDISEPINSGGYYEWDDDGTPLLVQMCIRSIEPPTFAEFRQAVKAATGVVLPEPEEPKWWLWYRRAESWVEGGGGHTVVVGNTIIAVYGTTADRDAKRDALLAAAKAAGKGAGA